jgi:uncharacterized protein (TIGR00661 family)
MNILYGLSGEGYGHSSRALIIVPYLQKLGHRVKVMTYGKGLEILKDKFDVLEIHGARLVFESNRIKKTKTILKNLKNFPINLLERQRLKKVVLNFKPDLCITDYEPLTYLLSKIYRLPLISIGNHQIIDVVKIKVPRRYYGQYLLTKAVNRILTPSADYSIISSFMKPLVKDKNTFIVPPLLREEIKKLKTRQNGRVLVYLNNADFVLDVLRKVDEKFIVYGFNKRIKDGNLEFRTKETFLRDLARCRAVIGTAGFTLISEALYLKKPYLAVPQRGQFEQVFNSLSLDKEGFGMFPNNFNKSDVLRFLKNLDFYKKNLANYSFNPNAVFGVLDRILKNI